MVDKKKDGRPETGDGSTGQSAQGMEQGATMTTEQTSTPETQAPAGNILERVAAVVKKFYPGTEVNTAIELQPEVSAMLEKLIAPIEGIVQFHDDFDKVVEEYPEFGDFVIALRNGYAPYEAFVEHLQPEEPVEGAPDYEGSKKAREARKKAVEDRKTRTATVESNVAGSLANIAKLAEAKGWTPEQTTEFENNVAALFTDWADGNLTMPSLENLAKGFAFDTIVKQKEAEVEQAFEDGKVNGMNAKIAKTRATRETGDGLARMTGTGSTAPTPDKFTTGLEMIAEKKNVI